MKLLIIGGTAFIGRALTRAALANGWSVTLFNRGQTVETPPEGVEWIQGDRMESFDALKNREWHAVIDTCAYTPRAVAMAAQSLLGQVECYCLISSISVYKTPSDTALLSEDAPLQVLENASVEQVTPATYGGLKALCEEAVREYCPENHLIIRPGLVVGPHDPTGRFAYWIDRFNRGGPILVPDDPDAPVQLIDASDLAEFILSLLHAQKRGVYNATGPSESFTLADFLNGLSLAFSGDAEQVRIDPSELIADDIQPIKDIPFWFHGESRPFGRVSIARALAEGISFHPLEETARRTHDWINQEGNPHAYGLTRKREREFLRRYRTV